VCQQKKGHNIEDFFPLVIEGEVVMSMKNRVLICLGILAVDLAIFFLPLTALFLIYIILCNPPWFREFLKDLNKKPDQL
jgi:hypothetical protein